MATKRKSKRIGRRGSAAATKKAGRRTTKNSAATKIAAWQDDPDSGLPVLTRDVPKLSGGPLKFRIKGGNVAAGNYAPGTAEFRYWTAAEALRRGGDFWAPILGVKRWQPGAVLSVGLDEGSDLNAYYDRSELAFFHDRVSGKTVYSGESPDVVCHEMGHACLDAHRPELWGAPFIEVGAFHESFGDMSAILSALQLDSVRQAAVGGLVKNKPSQLSRLAEQLGWAIRQGHATLVDKDCLRNACNSFDYVDPATLPDKAPATTLCTEVHSFSRVFTGAFYEILGGMLKTRSSKPNATTISAVATDCALLLLDATAAAPVQPKYYAQVASHMVDADTSRFGGKYRKVLTTTFVKRKILPHAAVAPLLAVRGRLPRAAESMVAHSMTPPPKSQTHKVLLNGAEFGLADRPLIVEAPVEQKPLMAVSAAITTHASGQPTTEVERATHRFVQMLFAHDRVEPTPGARVQRVAAADSSKSRRRTHILTEAPDGLRLVRRQFDCGCTCSDQ